MQKLLRQIAFQTLILLAGCATEPSKTQYIAWHLGDPHIRRLGARITQLVIQDSVELKPIALNKVISNALSPKINGGKLRSIPFKSPTSQLETNWSISESNEGQITTDWKPIPGKKAGLLWWEKTYETEVRHIITIKQSYHSNDRSTFSIITEVRERPNPSYPWVLADAELGSASFQEIKDMLLVAIQAALQKREAHNEN